MRYALVAATALLLFPTSGRAEWMQNVFDIRCVPNIGYFLFRPHYVSAPEHLQRPIVPTPTGDFEPTVTWDEAQLSVLANDGILFAGVEGQISCDVAGARIAVTTRNEGPVQLFVNERLIFDSSIPIGFVYPYTADFKNGRGYQFISISANDKLWTMQYAVTDRNLSKQVRETRIPILQLKEFHFKPAELGSVGITIEQLELCYDNPEECWAR